MSRPVEIDKRQRDRAEKLERRRLRRDKIARRKLYGTPVYS